MDDFIQGGVVLILILVAIYVVFYGISIALVFVYATIPLWGLTLFLGFCGFAIANSKINTQVKEPSNVSKLTNFSFDGLNFDYRINSDKIEGFANGYNYYAFSFCLISIVIQGIIFGNDLGLLVSPSDWYQLFGFELSRDWTQSIILAISLIITMTFLYNPNFTPKAKKAIENKLSEVRSSLKKHNDFLENVEKNKKLADEVFGIEFDRNVVQILYNYINENKEEIVSNPSKVNAFVSQLDRNVKETNENLVKAIESYNKILDLHYKVSMNKKTFLKNSSIINILDRIYRNIELAVIDYIPSYKWSEFFTAIEKFENELNNLKEQAAHKNINDTNDVLGPYEILEVSHDSTNQEIKKAWRYLCSKYHPDKVEHLGPKLKEVAESELKRINQAYAKIKEARNI